jgi:hypothetical protein
MKLPIRCKQSRIKLGQAGSSHHALLLGFVLLISVASVFRLVESHAAADSPKVTSGVAGYCLDDHDNGTVTNNIVDSWKCNSSAAQAWTVNDTTITHNATACLSVENNATTEGSGVVLAPCDSAVGQVWLRDNSGYENPNSNLCLSAPINSSSSQLIISSCSNLSKAQEQWTATTVSGKDAQAASCQGSEGTMVACDAVKEWTTWQNSSSNHENLLTSYTDGAPYEEWCADFVSYVYKEAGYPFTQGEADGWDESIADNIQNMGFTMHMASSGYVPQAGDVAYFDYAGGHVEIVVSGGKTPTFIYGNSATIDPTTGNGQMMANTITSKGSEGQVVYYLSPD